MNDDEKMLAESLYGAIQDASNFSERALQGRDFKAGVSDLGFCSERVRRMLDRQIPETTDTLKAWIGTALGDHAEKAALRLWPHAIVQSTVTVTLQGDQGTYTLTGHPDLILPEGILIDFKTDYGLASVRRTGPSRQQQFQRHMYAKGAHEGGLFNADVRLEDVQVANVWIDRAGIEEELHVQMELFSPDYVDEAAVWLDDVVYAYRHGEEARKEPPREMCAVVCGYYSTCRAYDTDVEGLITDDVTLAAVADYKSGLALEKQGKVLKDQARQHLVGVRGSTGEFFVRWVHVNETEIPASVRSGYDKLQIQAVKKAAK